MYKFLLLTIIVLFAFYIPQSFSESIGYASWTETAQLVIDENGGKTSVSLGIMSKNAEDIAIPEVLESMILNSPNLIGISYTNQYNCVPGVEEIGTDYILHEYSCVMIDVTKPSEIDNLRVPEVLLSGDHKKINKWRKFERSLRTKNKRPDLWLKRTKEFESLEDKS